MSFVELLMSNRRMIAVAGIAAIVGAGTVLLTGQTRGRSNPAATDAGKIPAAMSDAKPDNTFVDADSKLKELIKRQQMLGQQVAGIADAQNRQGASAAKVQTNAGAATGKIADSALRRQQMEMVMAARKTAVEEMMHAGGDTKKVVAAMEKFNKSINDTGLPNVLDMAKFRQMMDSVGRIQELSKQLTAENQKGQQADPAKVQSLLKQITDEQAAMPKSPYNMEALEKVMKSGQ